MGIFLLDTLSFKFILNSEHDAKESIVYSYTKSFNAFAANLSKDEAEMLMGTEILSYLFT